MTVYGLLSICLFLGEANPPKSSWAAGASVQFSHWSQSGSKALCRHVAEDARYIFNLHHWHCLCLNLARRTSFKVFSVVHSIYIFTSVILCLCTLFFTEMLAMSFYAARCSVHLCLYLGVKPGVVSSGSRRHKLASFLSNSSTRHACPVISCGRVFDNVSLLDGHLKRFPCFFHCTVGSGCTILGKSATCDNTVQYRGDNKTSNKYP